MSDVTPLDPAAIMAEHRAWSTRSQNDVECNECETPWPCLPFRLSAALAGWCPCAARRPQDCQPEDWPYSARHGLLANVADAWDEGYLAAIIKTSPEITPELRLLYAVEHVPRDSDNPYRAALTEESLPQREP